MQIALELDDVAALIDLSARAPKTPAETRFMEGLLKQINLKAKLAAELPSVPTPEPEPSEPPVP